MLGPVARDLLDAARGLPRDAGRELRYGRRGSLSVDLDRGVWFDHEAGVGGGTIALVEHMRGCGRSEALSWLRDGGHLPRDGGQPRPGVRRPQAASRPREASPSSSAPDARERARAALVRALWGASVPWLDGPARAYLESRRVWVAFGYRWVRWLPREAAPAPVPRARWWGVPRDAQGLLVFAYVRDGAVVAVSLEALDARGRPLPQRWRRTYGRRTGAAFRVREGGEVLHAAEGEIDALAIARLRSGSVYGLGGTSGLASCAALIGGHREMVIHADGDRGGRRAAARGLASVRARGVPARVCWYGGDPAEEVLG